MAERTLTLNLVSKAAKVAGAAGNVISGIGGHSFGQIGAAAGPEGAVVGGVIDKITQFAAKANPAAFERLQNVFDDLAAVVGDIFAPILELVTKNFRNFADVVAKIMPFIKLIVETMLIIPNLIQDLISKVLSFIPGASSQGRRPGGGGSLVGIGAVGDMARTSAFTAGGASPQEKTASYAQKIFEWIQKNSGADAAKRAIDGIG